MLPLLSLLEDPTMVGMYKLPPRSTSWPTRQLEVAPGQLLFDLDDCRLNLNGFWKFRWTPTLPIPRCRAIKKFISEKEININVRTPCGFATLCSGD